MRAETNDALQTLGPAYNRLDIGEVDSARQEAQQSLALARAGGDGLLEAEALLCLSVCDRYASRFRRCFESSLRASQLFQALGLHGRESASLTTLAYAAGSLGRYEEAVEASLLALRLLGDGGEKTTLMSALNYLGVTYFWSENFDEADAALASAISTAQSCEPHLPAFQPMLNLGFSRYFRASTERENAGKLPSLDAFNESISGCFDKFSLGGTLGMNPGLQLIGHAMWNSLASISHSWGDNVDAAEVSLANSRRHIAAFGSSTWLYSLAQLAETELLLAKTQYDLAGESAQRTLQLAAQTEHEPLARMAHSLLGYLYESRGRPDLALQAARKRRQREQEIRSEALASRAKVVDWQLAIRSSERNLEELQVLSRQLERDSLEDPLTHVANRRRIEQKLSELLRRSNLAAEEHPCVALIDVDSFKAINDTFSHQTGDRVLVKLAQIFASQSRPSDLVGRLAGDEFVVIFGPCSFDSALSACTRIKDAVAAYQWSDIASNLRVSVSIGLAKGRIGESTESILHRSDLAMYACKATMS